MNDWFKDYGFHVAIALGGGLCIGIYLFNNMFGFFIPFLMMMGSLYLIGYERGKKAKKQ